MILYIDESGNTGPIRFTEKTSNFKEQPYYVLAGVLLSKDQEIILNTFIEELRYKYNIQSDELKAEIIYNSKSSFIIDLVDFILKNKIPFFIKIMDKQFYLNTQLIDYFLLPVDLVSYTIEVFKIKKELASQLSNLLSYDVFKYFCDMCRENSMESFESFILFIKQELQEKQLNDILLMVCITEDAYLFQKENYKDAYKKFLPIPDKTNNGKLIYMLPNYNAFSNLVARVNQFLMNNNLNKFDIVHDEQKQFDNVYYSIINILKEYDCSIGTLKNNVNFNIDKNLNLSFNESKAISVIQVADLLSGFAMRFLKDFKAMNNSNLTKYNLSAFKLFHAQDPLGINFVIPNSDYSDIMRFVGRGYFRF